MLADKHEDKVSIDRRKFEDDFMQMMEDQRVIFTREVISEPHYKIEFKYEQRESNEYMKFKFGGKYIVVIHNFGRDVQCTRFSSLLIKWMLGSAHNLVDNSYKNLKYNLEKRKFIVLGKEARK